MKVRREQTVPILLVVLALTFNVIGLMPELIITRVDLNDNVLHFPLIQGMVQAVEHGRNPIDWWAPEWSLGYPVLRTYQPLAHAIVALVYFVLFKSVSLMTVFVTVRYLSVALLPLTFFITARLLSFSSLTAAAAAMLAPLISTSGLYGIEYGSYLWAGSGLFTQAVACHLLLLTIGFAYGAIRRGKQIGITGALLGLTFLAHFIYGYMAALSICLLSSIPRTGTPITTRILRTAWVGAIAFVLAAFEFVPMMLDKSIINHSRWEPSWKWDSFGANQVTKLLFTGELLDHGRAPAFTLLALLGVAFYFRDMYFQDVPGRGLKYPARMFVLLGSALWILLFFGRSFWGPVLTILGISPEMQLHRVVGGAHVFLVFLAAIGLAGVWRYVAHRAHAGLAAILTVLLFFPMVSERVRYLSNNAEWGRLSLAAFSRDRSAVESAIDIARDRGGRAFAGLPLLWGGSFKIGAPPFYAYLSEASVPAVGFMFHSMSLTSEIMTRFNESRDAHYRLFNIRTVVAPDNVTLPAFLTPLSRTGPLRILAGPESSYFDVVDAFYAVRTTKDNFYDINDRWLQSDWVASRQHLVLDLRGDLPPQTPRWSTQDPLPRPPAFPFAGSVLSSAENGGTYRAQLQAARTSYALFKMTWHPRWKALVDGNPVQTLMLSPGFVGVPISAGYHQIEMRYQPEQWKSVLAVAGFLFVGLIIAGERRGMKIRLRHFERLRMKTLPRPVATAAGLVLLALPVFIPLLTSKMSNGHDANEYLPRMVEFHENIVHGILLPRWAPDLSHGTGQPLFLFNPPMFYYLAEAWHLSGLDIVTSINLACIVLVLASAAGMFLLGKLYFGDIGGWLAATAYLYAPYFSVDLYVRSALAEFAAFPFFAFVLYGLGAYAKSGITKFLRIAAVAFAGLLLCHNPAALMFGPLLGGFVLFTAWMSRSWKVLRAQIFAIALGLGLAAFVWIPGVVRNHDVQVQSLLDGYSRYSNHFVALHQLFDSPWGYGLSVAGDQDGMSFALGWSHLVLFAVAVIWLAIRPRFVDRYPVWFFGLAAACLCWMVLPAAQPVWDRIRLLQFTAFPWRWLGPISICTAMLVASLGPLIASLENGRALVLAGAFALLMIPNLPHLHPREFVDVDLHFWTPQEIAKRGIEVSTFAEYRPRWMETSPNVNPPPAEIVSGSADIRQTSRTPGEWMGMVKANTAATAQVALAYFPEWQVRIDDAPVRSWPSDNVGLVRFQIPPGEHRIHITWARTAALWIGDTLSLLALFILAAAALPGWKMASAPESIALTPVRTE